MVLVTSVVAAVEHWQQVKRRYRYALYCAAAIAVILALLALWAVYDELAGDPWPKVAVTVVAVLLGTAILAGVTALSVLSATQATISASRVNGERIEKAETTMANLREDMHTRTELLHQVAVWVERMDIDLLRLGDLIDRAREQGRAEADQVARIREAHIRDEHRADLELVAREARRAGYDRGVEVGRAQRIEEEEQSKQVHAGLTPDVLDAFRSVHRRLTDEA